MLGVEVKKGDVLEKLCELRVSAVPDSCFSIRKRQFD
jgi:hypothetical protein